MHSALYTLKASYFVSQYNCTGIHDNKILDIAITRHYMKADILIRVKLAVYIPTCFLSEN